MTGESNQGKRRQIGSGELGKSVGLSRLNVPTEKRAIARRLREVLSSALIIAASVLFCIYCNIFYIQTGSMEPELPIGTIVITCSLAEPEAGDIYAYRTGSVTVVHRIREITHDGCIFQGDANNVADPYTVGYDQLVGEVILSLKLPAPLVRAAAGL